MGAHVYGKNPTSRAGEFFCVSFWEWRPIHDLVASLCSDLLSESLIEAMTWNDGAGPDDQATCTEMALRIDDWRKRHRGGHTIEICVFRVCDQRRIEAQAELVASPGSRIFLPYHASSEDLHEWTRFLRHCGGFEVW